MHSDFRNIKLHRTLSKLGETVFYEALFSEQPCLVRISNHPHPSEICKDGMANEKRLLSELNGDSPLFPRILIHDYWQDYLFTAYESSELRNVSEWRESQSNPDEFVDLSGQLIQGIFDLHNNGIALGNLSTPGLFINKENRPVILGLDNNFRNSSQTRLVNAAVHQELLPSFSPEMTGRTSRIIDSRSDIYSLGTIMFYLFTGRFPIEHEDPPILMHKILTESPGEISLPTELIRYIPVVKAIINKTLQKDPDKRYQNTSLLLHDWKYLEDMREIPGASEGFTAGIQDRKHGLSNVSCLYGRHDELKLLNRLYQETRIGHARTLRITAKTGMGKTCLVNQLRDSLDNRENYFLRIKFEQHRESSPFSGITRVLEVAADVTNRLLPNETKLWKSRLEDSLGERAGVLSNLCPRHLSILPESTGGTSAFSIAGQTPSIIYSTVSDFLRTLAGYERTLILFLDDIQWIDSSISQLLPLIAGDSIPGMFLICTSRREDPLTADSLQFPGDFPGFPHETIELENLDESALSSLVADISPLTLDSNARITGFLHSRTKGNPLFINEYIQEINRKDIVFFDLEKGKWELDYPKLINLPVFDTELGLISEMIEAMPLEIRRVLVDIAHLVSTFSLQDLVESLPYDQDLILKTLNYSINEGILIETEDKFSDEDERYRFAHDKIKEAVYSKLEVSSSRKLHSDIVLKLLEKFKAETEREHHMISRHLVQSGHLPDNVSFQVVLPILIHTAKSHFAMQNLEATLDVLRFLIPYHNSEFWKTNPADSHLIYKMAIECCYQLNQKEEAEEYAHTVMSSSGSCVEMAAVKELQMNYSFPIAEVTKALTYGEEGLKLLKFSISKAPGKLNVLYHFLKLKRILGKMSNAEILSLKENNSQEGKLAVRLYAGFIPPAYNAGKLELFGVAVLRSAQLSLKYGLSPESAAGFIGYAILLAAFGDREGAYRFGNLAVSINQKFYDPKWQSMVYMLHLLFCLPWKEDWNQQDIWIRKVKDASRISGDVLYKANAILDQGLWTPSLTLNELIEIRKKAVSELETLTQIAPITANKAYMHSYSILAGISPPESESAEYEKDIQDLLSAQQFSAAALCHLNTVRTVVFFEQSERYRDCLRSMENFRKALTGSCYEEELNLYSMILYVRVLHSRRSLPEKVQAYTKARKIVKTFALWARQNPLFLQHYYIGRALLAGFLNHRNNKALRYFEEAIETADHYLFVRYRAFFRELAADYCLSIGLDKMAEVYLHEALDHYRQYGAGGVITKLENKNPSSIQKRMINPDEKKDLSTDFDIHAILKTSQSLAQEIELEQLVRNILLQIIQNSGASRGILILVKNGNPGIVLEGDMERMTEQAFRNIEDNKSLNPDLVFEAMNSQNPIIDNGNESQSLLCFPFVSKQQVKAIVYLENNQVSGVFTTERIQILRLLSSAIVVSLENATLYNSLKVMNEELEERVQERTRELDLANVKLREKLATIEVLSRDLQLMAIKDELTGLYNRRYLVDMFPRMLSAVQRDDKALAVLMIDADLFKSVNDNYGHSVGDLVLRRIAETLQKNCRMHDQVFRLGGEEFLVLSPNITLEDAKSFAEKLRKKIESIDFSDTASTLSTTVSIGISLSDSTVHDQERLMTLADNALYKAKSSGRNRVEVAKGP